MLDGYRKKLAKETISYFMTTTNLSFTSFILMVQKNSSKDLNSLSYDEWLAVKSFQNLKDNGIILSDCFEFRTLDTQLKMVNSGINISPLWKKEIAKCIESTNLKDFTLFELSDSNSELQYLKDMPFYVMNSKKVSNNFFNTFDFDKDNPLFLRMLPKEVRNAILYKTPLFININPYLEKEKNVDSILEEMRLFGFNKRIFKDMLYVSLFRIIKMCEDYDLKDVRIGFFGPLDMFYERVEYKDFYSYFKKYFKFNTGLCFNPKSIGLKDKSEYVGYLIWDFKKENEKDVSIVLQERIQHTEDVILKGSCRLFRGKRDSLYDWVSKGQIKKGTYFDIPVFQNIQTKSDVVVQRYENILGYQQNTKNLLRSVKKVGVFNVPIGECTEINKDNFLKSVASFTVRSCLMEDDSYVVKPVYLSSPDMEIEGYKSWLADAIIYFTFSPLNMTKSYRECDFDLGNFFFPLSFSEVHKYVNDENIINDMNNHSAKNLEFLNIFDECKSNLSTVGKSFYTFCNSKITKSLGGKVREDVGYKDSLVAWDAGFYQIREIPSLFTSKDEEKYNYLLSELKDRLREGIYKFGFISEIL